MGIIDTAKGLIGKVTYMFGGDNIENGYGDCSDFTQYVYGKNGISIGGNTETQYINGSSVSELQPNDLVFFKDTYKSNYKDGVSHVGIYEGNGVFIHLSSSGVKESSLNDDFWKTHYLGARRYGTNDTNISTVTSDNLSQNVSGETVQSDGSILKNIVTTLTIIAVLITGIVLFYFSIKEA